MAPDDITGSLEIQSRYPSLIQKAKILVVDDDPAIITYISRALKSLGCPEYTLLTSASEAVSYADDHRFNILIMDIVFEKERGDGSSAASEIQKKVNVPVIYISGHSGDDIIDSIKKTRSSYFLQKPFSVYELKIIVELALYNHLENAARISDSRMSTIIEAITDYIYTVYLHDNIPVRTVHGAGCVSFTGYTVDEFDLNSFLWILMVPESERAMVEEHFRKLLRERVALPIEHRMIRKDGKIRWIRNTPVLYFDDDGNITSYDGIISDITMQKNAEEALIAQRESLEELVAQRTEHLQLINEELNATKNEIKGRNEKFMWDLVQAKKAQEIFLPAHNIEKDIILADYAYEPMELIGGDVLTYLHFKEYDAFGVFIGDVTGHGISAALYTSIVKVMLDRIPRPALFEPSTCLETLNRELFSFVNGNHSAHFLTGLYGYFRRMENGRILFEFSNAGQPYPMVYRKGGKCVETIILNGVMMGPFPEARYRNERIELDQGDRLFLYTDGIIEAQNEVHANLDFEGLQGILEAVNCKERSLQASIHKTIAAVRDFCGQKQTQDDIVLFGAEVR